MPRKPIWRKGPWHGRTGQLGGLLSEQPVLLRTAILVAYVTNIRVFLDGILFTAFAEQSIEEGPLKPTHDLMMPLTPSSSDEPVVTVTFPDGYTWRDDPDMDGDCLVQGGVSLFERAEGVSWRAEYWLPALPAEGPVVFCISVGEYSGTASVDGGTVIAAAKRAIDLWEQPEV
jgi:hypothetical protein